MMLVDLIAGSFEEISQSTMVRRKTEHFGRSITETKGIARRARGVKDEIQSYKGADPNNRSVTKWFMIAYRQDIGM